jgi:hypothetical protein
VGKGRKKMLAQLAHKEIRHKEIREGVRKALRKAGFRPAPVSEELLGSYLYNNTNNSSPLTPQSFLHYSLKGKARDYSSTYFRAFMARLEALREAGLIESCESARGHEAYRWKSQG